MDPVGQQLFQNDVLEIDSLPKFEEVELQPFAPNYLLKKNISTTIWLFVVVVGLGFAYTFAVEFRSFFPFVAAAFVLIFAWSYLSNYQWYKKSGYAVRERDLIFKRGFLYEKTTVVPFNRVQHVSTNRSLLDKMLNLSTLNIFTAGGSGSDITLPGLLPEKADRLKETIAERMSDHV